MVFILFSLLYFSMCAFTMHLISVPLSNITNLLFFLTDQVHLLLLTNFLISCEMLIYTILKTLVFSTLSFSEFKNVAITMFEKSSFNIIMIYSFHGLVNIDEFVAWILIFTFSYSFISLNIIMHSRLKSLTLEEGGFERQTIKYFILIGILISVNVTFLYQMYSFFMPQIGNTLFIILFFEYFRSLFHSTNLLIILCSSVSTKFFSANIRHKISNYCFYHEKVILLVLAVANIFFNLFLLHLKRFSNVFFVIIVLKKLYHDIRSAISHVSKSISFYKMTKYLSESFQEASSEQLEKSNYCVICCDSISEGKRLDCGHIFHSFCIINWIKFKNICPICRKRIKLSRTQTPQRSRRGFNFNTPIANFSLARNGNNSTFRFSTISLGSFLPSISFEFQQVQIGPNGINRLNNRLPQRGRTRTARPVAYQRPIQLPLSPPHGVVMQQQSPPAPVVDPVVNPVVNPVNPE